MMNNNLYDEYAQLSVRIKSGDQNAFTELYNKSERLVYATCLGILRNPEDAADATQETYMTIYNKIGSFNDDRMLLGWIKTIAANKSLDMYRRKRGNVSYDDTIAVDEELQGDDNLETLPDTYIMVEEKRNILRKILKEELSDVQYQTVILYYYDELPVETIAQLMNCPEGTVKTRLKASRVKIKSGIEKYEKDNDDKFAAAAAFPFLTKFFKGEAEALTLPTIDLSGAAKNGSLQAKEGTGAKDGAYQQASKSQGGTAFDTAKDSAWTASKTSSKEGFLSTVAGKITVTALAGAAVVATAVGIVALVNNNDDEDETETTFPEVETVDVIEPTEDFVETEPSSVPDVTAETESSDVTEATGIEYVEPVVEGEPILMNIDELPEADQLKKFVQFFHQNGYDCETGFEWYYLGNFLPNSSMTEILIDYSQYFDGFTAESITDDPNGTLPGTSCKYRINAEYLFWIEENIFNLSEEKMDILNSGLYESDGTEYYLADDGYIYYRKGDAGSGEGQFIVDVTFDGEYYHVRTSYYGEEQTGPYLYYTMKLKYIDGRYYWSIIRISDTVPSWNQSGTSIVRSDVEVGDYVVYGRYEQDNDLDNGAEPIKWEVLDIQDGKALLISKYVLDYEWFNESEYVSGNDYSVSLPWNNSYIRTWLNSEFSDSAFTSEEFSSLADMTDYSARDEYDDFVGDYISGVFLLSYDDVMNYYGAVAIDYDEDHHDIYSMSLLCLATPYARHNTTGLVEEFTQKRYDDLTGFGFVLDESVIGNDYACWWLRTSFYVDSWFTAEGHAMLVEQDGRVDLSRFGFFNEKDRQRGIRPCVWVDLDQAGDLITVTDDSVEEWMIPSEEEEKVLCTWEIDGTRLIITGNDIPNGWHDEDVPWFDSVLNITEVEINGMEKIPNHLLYGLENVQRVYLGDETTDMKRRAFDDLPEGVVIVYRGQEYTAETIRDVLD